MEEGQDGREGVRMTNMLTRIVSNRVYDFSHVVGGRQLTGIVQLALGDGDDVYLVMRRRNGGNLMKLTIGPVPGDEEIVGQIGKSGTGLGEFVWPTAAAIDSNGYIYVTDEWLHRVTVFDRDGDFVRTFGEQGAGEGQFDRPSGIAIDGDDNVIVSDTLNHRVQKLTPDGESIAAWGCKGDGPGEFDSPWGVTTDDSDAIYTIQAAPLAFGASAVPRTVIALGDRVGGAMVDYGDDKYAILTFPPRNSELPEVTELVGTEGRITLERPAHCPTRISIRIPPPNGVPSQYRTRNAPAPLHYFEYPLPGSVAMPRSSPNQHGFLYQAEAVHRCLAAGLRQCPQYNKEESLHAMHVLTEINKARHAALHH